MNTEDIKDKLHRLVDKEEDFVTLEAIYHLLSKAQHESRMRETLTKRATVSEQDIQDNLVSDVDEVYRRLKA